MSVDMIKNIEALEGIKVDAGAYADLIHQRNTLVTALRECVVALVVAECFYNCLPENIPLCPCGRCMAITHAKSTLERYKHEHP